MLVSSSLAHRFLRRSTEDIHNKPFNLRTSIVAMQSIGRVTCSVCMFVSLSLLVNQNIRNIADIRAGQGGQCCKAARLQCKATSNREWHSKYYS
jgi:hypothetical protein